MYTHIWKCNIDWLKSGLLKRTTSNLTPDINELLKKQCKNCSLLFSSIRPICSLQIGCWLVAINISLATNEGHIEVVYPNWSQFVLQVFVTHVWTMMAVNKNIMHKNRTQISRYTIACRLNARLYYWQLKYISWLNSDSLCTTRGTLNLVLIFNSDRFNILI
jgi:hypothetical protein